jgi:glycosyltransferase involved in cell wall biosynthesis
MKVLFITQTFFPKHKGGTEVYLLNLCKILETKKVACKIICTDSGNEEAESYLYESISIEAIPPTENICDKVLSVLKTEEYNILHIHTLGGRLDNTFLAFLKIKEIAYFFTPHLVGNFCLNGGRLQYKNQKACNGYVSIIKCQTCISGVNEGLHFVFKNKIGQFILQRIIPGTLSRKWFSKYHFLARMMKDRIAMIKERNVTIIAVSEWYAGILKLNGCKNVSYIPQGLNPLFMEESKIVPGVKEGFSWTFIGRLSEEKGIDELVEVFINNALPEDSLNFIFFVKEVPGDFEEMILDKVRSHVNIRLYRNSSPEKVFELLKESDCLVVPSKVCEMAPLVFQEAFACRVPVLISNYIREDIVSKKLGLQFDYNKENDFDEKFNFIRSARRDILFSGLSEYKKSSFEDVAITQLGLYKVAIKA